MDLHKAVPADLILGRHVWQGRAGPCRRRPRRVSFASLFLLALLFPFLFWALTSIPRSRPKPWGRLCGFVAVAALVFF